MDSVPGFRQGCHKDETWLFQLFRTTMQDFIDKAWGWDELLQREGFVTSLPAQEFQILEIDGDPVGCYHLTEKPDCLLLDMILVDPARQRQGYGRLMMQAIKSHARVQDKPLRLSVLKTNPAVRFHVTQGFSTVAEDRYSLQMSWS